MSSSYWMPFTANRQFLNKPKHITSAEGIYYQSSDGKKILDSISGLWCSNLGHCRPEINNAITKQLNTLDYCTSFQVSHNNIEELSDRLVNICSKSQYTQNLKHIFYTNSGSESADTALKIALAYHKSLGNHNKTILIGRQRGYHGTCFGGMSLGGIENNKKQFRPLLQNTDHLPDLLDIDKNAFSKGFPLYGVEHTQHLDNLISKHGADNIAAVMIEPFSGSGGVIIPPVGYLQKIREITKKHNILLIFDEVITGFGRVGDFFASQRWQVQPDIITTAKGITNGAIPMGAVLVSDFIYDALMHGDERIIELFHGFTYSGHPVAAAAALACLDIYEQPGFFEHTQKLEVYLQDCIHNLKGLPNIIDIRNIGLAAAIEFKAPNNDLTGKYGYYIFDYCFNNGLLVRHSGDIVVVAPALIVTKEQIDFIVHTLKQAIIYAADQTYDEAQNKMIAS